MKPCSKKFEKYFNPFLNIYLIRTIQFRITFEQTLKITIVCWFGLFVFVSRRFKHQVTFVFNGRKSKQSRCECLKTLASEQTIHFVFILFGGKIKS